MGYYRKNSTIVGLIRNIKTVSVTPKCHVVYDDKFETVEMLKVRGNFDMEYLFKNIRENSLDIEEENNSELSEEWTYITLLKDKPIKTIMKDSSDEEILEPK